MLSTRQRYRHLAEYLEVLGAKITQDANGGSQHNNGDNTASDDHLTQLATSVNIDIHDETTDEPPFQPPIMSHGPHRNPPVTIMEWPNPDIDPEVSDDDEPASNSSGIPYGDPGHIPEFSENTQPPQLNPLDEPELTDDEIQQLLQADLGDLAKNEWVNMYTNRLVPKDLTTLQFLASRLRTHFSRQTYEDLRHGAFGELGIPSEFIAWRRLRILSGLETRTYDCCINSCCCFLGKYKDAQTCEFCGEARYNARGSARRVFRYSPLIPQLQALFQCPKTVASIRYRVRAERAYDPKIIQDVFDGANYRTLRATKPNPNNEYRFFSHPNDLALGLSTDGFSLFKRRRRGHSTAWPIILINYNLHPKLRTRLENVICVGVIPGPKQCRDLNSFLIPLIEELLQLEEGVESTTFKPENADTYEPEDQVGAGNAYRFKLRGFVIIIFGDIPAITKLLLIKGHNAFTPCRTCYIQGVLCKLRKNSIYYYPLMHPDDNVPTPHLHMRTHQLFLHHYDELESRPQDHEALAKDYGINGRSVLARLHSINLATSFPYDIMHLFFENLVPNMIRHWTGTFKHLDQGTGTYQISEVQWEGIGRLTTQATPTIPSTFVGTLPNIARDRNLYKAEAYAFWIQYMAPILLKGVLTNRYYKHLLLLREIIMLCLQFEITRSEINELQAMVNKWVAHYEMYYYQYQESRLPACPLTIHALLHIPFYIQHTGPLWASWAFVMERFCGHLLPAVKNRTRPYDHLDNYVQRRAQMQITSKTYQLPSLAKPFVNYRHEGGEQLSSREVIYPGFAAFILGTPVNENVSLSPQLLNRMQRFFVISRPGLRVAQLKQQILEGSIKRHGRLRMAGDGDIIRTADLIDRDPIARDNSYIKYELLPDANAAYRNREDEPVRETQYGQLLDIYYVQLCESDNSFSSYLLACVQPCKTNGLDATAPECPVVTYKEVGSPDIVHANTIIAVVGRIKLGTTWAIVDRSRGNARTQFIDDNGNVEFDA